MNANKRIAMLLVLMMSVFGSQDSVFGATAPVHPDVSARTVQYADTDIIRIRAKVRYSTLIVLPADEEILDATTGDKEYWIINGAHNLCYLHPAKQGIESNLNLITASGHVYSFLLTEVSNEPGAEPDLKLFVERKEESTIASAGSVPPLARASDVEAYKSAVQAADAEAAQEVQAAQDQARKEIEQYRQQYAGALTFDYSYDSKAAQPPFSLSAIYHDDKFTYIKSSAEEKPTVYEIKDGKPNLINFDLANGVYVIPKILDASYLVLGKKKLNFERHGNGRKP